MPLKSHEIRSQFLEFFRARGHEVVPGSPLVPQRDPSLLFTTAGMVQFKPLYSGEGPLPYLRAASSQPCLRATDLERVGHTARHLTFFEMLGNFSFGDYFKRESLVWGWEFLTGVMQIDPSRLYVSVFEQDDEAADIWERTIGLDPSRIFRLGAKDNFWGPAGSTGACGPSSEIYWDFLEHAPGVPCGLGRRFVPGHAPDDEHCGPSCDCDRFMEVWNHVFPQFNQLEDGSRVQLARKGIDTGMSVERLTTVLQGARSIFDTDLFTDLRTRLEAHVGADWRATRTNLYERNEIDVAIKVISDHARAITFVIAEGVYPGNEGRGYLVRRLLRRAYAKGRVLGFADPFLHTLVPTVVASMHGSYPLLARQIDAVVHAVRAEEESFARTIEQGVTLLSAELNAIHPALGLDGTYQSIVEIGNVTRIPPEAKPLAGDVIFRLHDTYGFPVDLTRDIYESLGGTRFDGAGYDAEMEKQRTRARKASKFAAKAAAGGDKGRRWRKVSKGAHSRFIGYTHLESPARVRMVREGDKGWPEVEVVLDRTPFYPEGGGQVADRGVIAAEHLAVEVADVQREAGTIVHRGVLMTEAPGEAGAAAPANVDMGELLQVAERGPMEAHVAERHRLSTARNHTATHLLHAALRSMFGAHVRQAGSLVAPEHLRFDFSHFAQPSRDEMERLETEVNGWILRDVPIKTAVENLEDALQSGAMALFGEKYDHKVRVVEVADFSLELCGGTHVRSTGEIGPFLLVSEGSVGSGVRRVEAVTGDAALERLRDNSRTMEALAQSLGVSVRDILPRVEALLAERETMRKMLDQAQAGSVRDAFGAALANAEDVGGAKIVVSEVPGGQADALREAADALRGQMKRGAAVFAARGEGGKVTFLAAVTDDLVREGVLRADDLVREVAKVTGGSGGGKPHLALAGAKDASLVPQALAHGREVMRAKLAAVAGARQ